MARSKEKPVGAPPGHPGWGGRPRSKDRCPCGMMTRKRAALRRHKCERKAG